MEKWILRGLLATVAGLLLASVIGSADDIKRYLKMRQM